MKELKEKICESNKYFGKEIILDENVKYIGEGEDPAENPYMKAYVNALKEVYKGEKNK